FPLSPLIRRSQIATVFPYPTLFRSDDPERRECEGDPHREPHAGRRAGEPHAVSRSAPRVEVGFVITVELVREVGCQDGLAHSPRSEEHTSELQSRENLVCRLLLEKK